MVVNGLRSNTKNLVHYIMMNVYVQLKYKIMHISQQAQNLKTALYQCQRARRHDVALTLIRRCFRRHVIALTLIRRCFVTAWHRIDIDTTLFCDGMASHCH